MSELTIIVITLSALIAVFLVVRVIEKGKHINAKANIKDGTIEIGSPQKIENNIEKQNKVVDNAFNTPYELSVLESKNNNEILTHYKNVKYDDSITKLIVYREYSNIVSQSTIKVFSNIISYIARNHILSKNAIEYEEYVKKKRAEIIDIYDKALAESDIESISNLDVNKISGYYYVVILDMIKDFYLSIYNNHKEQENKRKEFLKNLKNIEAKNRLKSYEVFITNNFTETTIKDADILLESLDYLQKFLLGIFHDNLKYNGGK